jgi:DNA-directed RNA polymerase specialized sigma24 family protein
MKTCSAVTDSDLFAKFVETRDPRYFDPIVRRHRAEIVQQAFKTLRDRAAAEDVAHEVFVKLLAKRCFKADGRKFGKLIGFITRCEIANYRRRALDAVAEEVFDRIMIRQAFASATPEEVVDRRQTIESITGDLSDSDCLRLLEQAEEIEHDSALSPLERRIAAAHDRLKARLQRPPTHQEIGAELGLTADQVGSAAMRMKRKGRLDVCRDSPERHKPRQLSLFDDEINVRIRIEVRLKGV